MAEVTVDSEKLLTRPVDQTGRVSIGTEYAGHEVQVAVVEVADRERWAAEQVIDELLEEGDSDAAEAVADAYGLAVE